MKPFQITYQDYTNAQKLHGGWKVFAIMSGLLCLIAVTTIGRDLADGEPGVLTTSIMAVAMAAGLFFGVYPFAVRKKYRQIYNAQAGFKEEIRLSFNSAGLDWAVGAGVLHVDWSDIVGHKAGRGLILLYEADQQMRILPDTAFEGAEERDRFLQWLG